MSLYSVHRTDRSSATSDRTRGGGVLIAVSMQLRSFHIEVKCSGIEEVFVGIQTKKGSLVILGCVYIPPGSNHGIFENHMKSVQYVTNLYPDCEFIMVGDYNLVNVEWIPDAETCILTPLCNNNHVAEYVLDNFNFLGCNQYNAFTNSRSSNILDLCFATCDVRVFKCDSDSCMIPCDDFHPALQIEFDIDLFPKTTMWSYEYDFARAPYYLINRFLSSLDWNHLFLKCDVNHAVNIFYDTIYFTFESFVPKIRCYKSTYPCWFTKRLQMLTRDKKLAHRKYKATCSHSDYNKFSELRTRCKILTEQTYRNYITNSENSIVSNSKNFWKFVNSKRHETGLPTCMKSEGNAIVNDTEIADCFAEEFTKAFSVHDNSRRLFFTDHQVDFNNFHVSAITVHEKLMHLDTSSKSGDDFIPPVFLKSCAESLFIPLYLLFRISLETCTFPDRWKVSKIVPIYKGGPKSTFTNYRPVAKLSVIPKMFEALLAPQLCYAFRQIIDDNQHGFCAGKSVETNLFGYASYLFTSIAAGKDVHAIYTDFAKAFDSVNHELLLFKLTQYGVGSSVTNWLASYLTDRTAYVVVRNSSSRPFSISSGVPQGSHLGPYLFLVFINDIGRYLSSPYLLFADDLKIYRSVQNNDDTVILQNDLTKIESWCEENDMKLNTRKCKSIAFSKKYVPSFPNYYVNGACLEVVHAIRDLGVTFDSKLSFIGHIDNIVSKASRMWGLISRSCREFTNTHALCTLYFGLVRSHLDYCSLIWSPFYDVHINRIEAIQHRFLKLIRFKLSANKYSNFESINIADYLCILSLRSRRLYLSSVFFFKVINGYSSSASILSLIELHVPHYGVRAGRLVSSGPCRTLYELYSPLNCIARSVNAVHLDVDFFGISLVNFKYKLHRCLLSR